MSTQSTNSSIDDNSKSFLVDDNAKSDSSEDKIFIQNLKSDEKNLSPEASLIDDNKESTSEKCRNQSNEMMLKGFDSDKQEIQSEDDTKDSNNSKLDKFIKKIKKETFTEDDEKMSFNKTCVLIRTIIMRMEKPFNKKSMLDFLKRFKKSETDLYTMREFKKTCKFLLKENCDGSRLTISEHK